MANASGNKQCRILWRLQVLVQIERSAACANATTATVALVVGGARLASNAPGRCKAMLPTCCQQPVSNLLGLGPHLLQIWIQGPLLLTEAPQKATQQCLTSTVALLARRAIAVDSKCHVLVSASLDDFSSLPSYLACSRITSCRVRWSHSPLH